MYRGKTPYTYVCIQTTNLHSNLRRCCALRIDTWLRINTKWWPRINSKIWSQIPLFLSTCFACRKMWKTEIWHVHQICILPPFHFDCTWFQHGDSKFDVSSLSRSESGSSTQSMQHGGMPELLLGLSYNGTTGRLSVEVLKGSNFRNMAMNRAPGKYGFHTVSPTWSVSEIADAGVNGGGVIKALCLFRNIFRRLEKLLGDNTYDSAIIQM